MSRFTQYPQINVRVDEAFLTRLDAWRRKQLDPPTRPAALKALAERALDAEEQATKKKRS
jgi:hypothetical protein